MNNYIFNYIQSKNKCSEIITMTYHNNDETITENIGNIYNLVDYITISNFDNDSLTFNNFRGNELNFIYSVITRYKNIITVLDYNTVLVSNKKRIIRGR